MIQLPTSACAPSTDTVLNMETLRNTMRDFESLSPTSARGCAPVEVIGIPDVLRQKRTWRERLLSWPWKPLVTHKFVDNPVAPRKGEYWTFNNPLNGRPQIICRVSDEKIILDKVSV